MRTAQHTQTHQKAPKPFKAKPTPVPRADMPIMRKCACGGSCPKCNEDIQPKLHVSQAHDPLEREADRAADRVMNQSPDGPAPMLSKATPAPQRAASQSNEDEQTSGVNLQSGGQPLSTELRGYFEPRFGQDFSQVRVHHNAQAADMADSINARAFTQGQHIAFAQGQYSPQTLTGRHLIAHELAHTVQQGKAGTGAPVQRKSNKGPFTVDGLSEDRKKKENQDFIFFERARPPLSHKQPEKDVDPTEAAKVDTMMAGWKKHPATKPKKIQLIGYASEEGSKAFNTKLIDQRLKAVKNLLSDTGKASPVSKSDIKTQPQLKASANKIDFRFWRAVEIRENGQQSERKPTGTNTFRNCKPSEIKLINNARGTAKSRLNKAKTGLIPKLNAYIANPSKEPVVGALLARYYAGDKSITTAKKVRDRAVEVEKIIDKISTHSFRRCGDPDHNMCSAGATAGANVDSVKFCPKFFGRPVPLQASILMHEAGHAITPTPAVPRLRDWAYGHARNFPFLNLEQALLNTDTLTIMAQHLASGSAPSRLKNAPSNKLNNCSGFDKKVNESVAWAAKWNFFAKSGIAQTYGRPARIARMKSHFLKHFKRADAFAMAGIFDRYSKMDQIFDKNLDVSCLDAKAPQCKKGQETVWTSQTALQICTGTFGPKTLDQRIISVLAALAAIMPGVLPSQREAYAKLARDYMTQFWGMKWP